MSSLESEFGKVEWATEERIDLSAILSVSFETEKKLALHIESTEDLDFAKKFSSLKEGLNLLADCLVKDAGYKDVEDIYAYSAIVALHPDVLKGLGFTIDDEDGVIRRTLHRKYLAAESEDPVSGKYAGIEPALAHITKQEFLALYGDKSKVPNGENVDGKS